MPLPMPRLDSRNFDQLVEEGTALLPRLAPGWTDYNLHDPGITLMELLAWLVEMDMYRLDRTSQAAFRAFLRLVGCTPRPPQIAETAVVFKIKSNDPPKLIHAGSQISNQDGQVQFQTTRGLVVLPAKVVSVLAGAEAALVDCSEHNLKQDRHFAPFGPDPQVGHALYIGFDQALPANTSRVSLYVWVYPGEKERLLRLKLSDERKAEAARLKKCNGSHPFQRPSIWQHYSARTVWEYYANPGQWNPLEQVSDKTRGLTLSGAVRFKIPLDPPHAKCAFNGKTGQFFIRFRLASGYYECPPEIQHIALNAVPAHHAVKTHGSELLVEKSSGHAGQIFPLQKAPIVSGSTHLLIHAGGRDEAWQEALDWDRAGPLDRTYVLSPESGEIQFGNGLHGRVPKTESKITAVKYRHGGGAAGNVRANSLTHLAGADEVEVQQPFAAFGGADAETLDAAKARAIQWLSEPRRAVSLADYKRLALAMPGVPIRRAHAIPDFHPALLGLPALGCVTLVVVAGCANPLPEPGPDMLRAVHRYLEPRRTLTTELHVMGPAFVTIAVHATLNAGPDANDAALIDKAVNKLNTFLDPLRGGADGQGWPFGRDVYQSEIMALLNAIPGVVYVDQVELLVESRLEVFQGYITWMQTFERGGAVTVLRAQLRAEPGLPASRLTAQARLTLDAYFQSPRGKSKHVSNDARARGAAAQLSSLPGMLRVEEVKLEDQPGPAAPCGNVSICPHGLVVPGRHQITLSGARQTCSPRAAKPPC